MCVTGNCRMQCCRSWGWFSLSTAPRLFASCGTSLQPAPDEKHRCVKRLKWKSLWKQQEGGRAALPWEMIWLGEEKFPSGHLLSAALSQDHKPFWVTGLRARLQKCSQLPADFYLFIFSFISNSSLRRMEEPRWWRLGYLRERRGQEGAEAAAHLWGGRCSHKLLLGQKHEFSTPIFQRIVKLCTSNFTKSILGKIWPNLRWSHLPLRLFSRCSKPTDLLRCGTACPLSALHELPSLLSAPGFFWSGANGPQPRLCARIILPAWLSFVIGSARPKDAVHRLTHRNACKMSNQGKVCYLQPLKQMHEIPLIRGVYHWHQIFGFWGKTRPFIPSTLLEMLVRPRPEWLQNRASIEAWRPQ